MWPEWAAAIESMASPRASLAAIRRAVLVSTSTAEDILSDAAWHSLFVSVEKTVGIIPVSSNRDEKACTKVNEIISLIEKG